MYGHVDTLVVRNQSSHPDETSSNRQCWLDKCHFKMHASPLAMFDHLESPLRYQSQKRKRKDLKFRVSQPSILKSKRMIKLGHNAFLRGQSVLCTLQTAPLAPYALKLVTCSTRYCSASWRKSSVMMVLLSWPTSMIWRVSLEYCGQAVVCGMALGSRWLMKLT